MTAYWISYCSSLLHIETADRPGLLVEIIKIIADVNVDVESAEIETEVLPPSISLSWGAQAHMVAFTSWLFMIYWSLSHLLQGLVAKDKFHVSYRGAALNSSLSQVSACIRGFSASFLAVQS